MLTVKLWFAKMKVSHAICGLHEDSDNFWPNKAFRLDQGEQPFAIAGCITFIYMK